MKKEFIKTLNSIDYSRNSYEVFADFLTLASISLCNTYYKNEEYENEYGRVISRYKKPDLFPVLFGMIAEELERNPWQDLLGELYMSSDFGNKHTGQFFTPFHLSDMMAQVTIDENLIKNDIEKRGYFTLAEPACGAGGLIIAAAKTLKNMGLNPQQCMYFDATDLDQKCFEMTFIQTSLLGLCGDVHWGNTLSMETYRTYETPIKFLDIWQMRFAIQKAKILYDKLHINVKPKEVEKPKVFEITKNKEYLQLSLI